jgi:hypothetical protein
MPWNRLPESVEWLIGENTDSSSLQPSFPQEAPTTPIQHWGGRLARRNRENCNGFGGTHAWKEAPRWHSHFLTGATFPTTFASGSNNRRPSVRTCGKIFAPPLIHPPSPWPYAQLTRHRRHRGRRRLGSVCGVCFGVGAPSKGKCPGSQVNDGACPENRDHLTALKSGPRSADAAGSSGSLHQP